MCRHRLEPGILRPAVRRTQWRRVCNEMGRDFHLSLCVFIPDILPAPLTFAHWDQGSFIEPAFLPTSQKVHPTRQVGVYPPLSSQLRGVTQASTSFSTRSYLVGSRSYIFRITTYIRVFARHYYLRYAMQYVKFSRFATSCARTTGDWAGSSYATSGCPGSCGATVQDPSNFIISALLFLQIRVHQRLYRMRLGLSTRYMFIRRRR